MFSLCNLERLSHYEQHFCESIQNFGQWLKRCRISKSGGHFARGGGGVPGGVEMFEQFS